MALQSYQQRVVDEKAELDGKLARLSSFMESDYFLKEIAFDERCRMAKQAAIMASYSEILGERIAAFKC